MAGKSVVTPSCSALSITSDRSAGKFFKVQVTMGVYEFIFEHIRAHYFWRKSNHLIGYITLPWRVFPDLGYI